MADKKIITPKEAGIAVLKKFSELLTKAEKEGKPSLTKSSKIKKEDPMGMMYSEDSKKDLKKQDPIAGMMGSEKDKKDLKKDDLGTTATAGGTTTIGGQIGNPFGKAEDSEAGNSEHFKGHLKLAKFIGYMEGKKSKMGAQGPVGGVLENQSKEQVMDDSGNNDPLKPVSNVGPTKNSLAKSSESKHDRCVEHVKENSPEVKNPHAVCVAEGIKPANQKK